MRSNWNTSQRFRIIVYAHIIMAMGSILNNTYGNNLYGVLCLVPDCYGNRQHFGGNARGVIYSMFPRKESLVQNATHTTNFNRNNKAVTVLYKA